MRRPTTWLTLPTLLAALAIPLTVGAPTSYADRDVPFDVGLQDPTGDSTGTFAPARERADIRKVRYVGPHDGNDTLWLRVQMDHLYDARDDDRLRQGVTVTLKSANRKRTWVVFANNRGEDVRVTEQPPIRAERRIEVDRARLVREYGKNGFFSIRLSSEWLRNDRVRVRTYVQSGNGHDYTRWQSLDVSGESDGVTIVEPTPPSD